MKAIVSVNGEIVRGAIPDEEEVKVTHKQVLVPHEKNDLASVVDTERERASEWASNVVFGSDGRPERLVETRVVVQFTERELADAKTDKDVAALVDASAKWVEGKATAEEVGSALATVVKILQALWQRRSSL